MAEYHKYVFDTKNRRFLGKFEEMYRKEKEGKFDSWHQDDLRHLDKQICLNIVNTYNFNKILDIGCGKGAFTQFLKKSNNVVIGYDISEAAIEMAKARFTDIEFRVADISDKNFMGKRGEVDLIVCMEVLSYIKNWQNLLKKFSRMAQFVLIKLFIPEDPIGYVKNFDQLLFEFSASFQILEDVRLINRKIYILFGKSLNNNKNGGKL